MNQTILDRNNQSITVDLICYFSNNGKKYAFYSKNETVQDGLIKMYVAEENMGLTNDISQDDWSNLKKIMQGIITGNTSDIQFLAYNNSVKFNEPKAIALNDTNINTIKTAFKNATQNIGGSEPILNKDILTQNFGGNTESINTSEPVQISPIPNIQNNFNMESTPVNLNANPIVEENVNQSIQNNEPINNGTIIPSVESVNSEQSIPSIEPIPSVDEVTNVNEPIQNTSNSDEIALNINSIKPGGFDSGFKVSNEPNIFDNPDMPYQITEEEINKPIVSEVSEAFNSSPVLEPVENKLTIKVGSELNNKKIELNNRKIKLFEELASIYKEENELLKSELNDSNDALEHTASNLFNSNGTLNDSIIN